jgi:hypothetical protein
MGATGERGGGASWKITFRHSSEEANENHNKSISEQSVIWLILTNYSIKDIKF